MQWRLRLHAWRHGADLQLFWVGIQAPPDFGFGAGALWKTGELSQLARDGYISLGDGAKLLMGSRTRFDHNWHIRMITSQNSGLMEIGEDCCFENSVALSTFGKGQLRIGHHCFIGRGSTLSAHESLEIGEGTAIAEYVSIRDHNHVSGGKAVQHSSMAVAPIRIGRRVWIGAKATIIAGVEIGDDAVIGANAVVTRNVPSGARVGGVPARPLSIRPKPGVADD